MFNIQRLLKVLRVTGDSMSPILRHGDYVIASSLIKPKLDRIVIVEHPVYGTMVKRVCELTDDGVLLVGENDQSLSSEKMGWLPLSCVEGCVIKHIKQPRA